MPENVECPECKGYGSWDVIDYLYQNGNQKCHVEYCERCHGAGVVPENDLSPEEIEFSEA